MAATLQEGFSPWPDPTPVPASPSGYAPICANSHHTSVLSGGAQACATHTITHLTATAASAATPEAAAGTDAAPPSLRYSIPFPVDGRRIAVARSKATSIPTRTVRYAGSPCDFDFLAASE